MSALRRESAVAALEATPAIDRRSWTTACFDTAQRVGPNRVHSPGLWFRTHESVRPGRRLTGRAGAALTRSGQPVRYSVTGIRDGVNIKVILQPGGEGVISGYPVP